MTVSIYGAGMAGTYLAKLLEKYGIKYAIYDNRKYPDCRCAWGIMYRQAKELMYNIDYDIDDYVLNKPNEIVFNDIHIKNKNLCIFSKMLWLNDLWRDLYIRKPEKDIDTTHINVDATGNARAIIGKPDNYTIARCIQYRILNSDLENNIYIYTDRPTGYAWAFPLSETEWHVGAGAIKSTDVLTLFEALMDKLNIQDPNITCKCSDDTKVAHTQYSELPLYDMCKQVITIGEAGGFVSAAGEGNLLAMESASILGDILLKTGLFINIVSMYKEQIRMKFSWLNNQYKLLYAMEDKDIVRMIQLIPRVSYVTVKRLGIGIEDVSRIIRSVVGV